jgi:hypothetical protein
VRDGQDVAVILVQKTEYGVILFEYEGFVRRNGERKKHETVGQSGKKNTGERGERQRQKCQAGPAYPVVCANCPFLLGRTTMDLSSCLPARLLAFQFSCLLICTSDGQATGLRWFTGPRRWVEFGDEVECGVIRCRGRLKSEIPW